MASSIRAGRFLALLLVVALIWVDLAARQVGADEGLDLPVAGERPGHVTSRGGARPTAVATPGQDLLAMRLQLPLPQSPSPTRPAAPVDPSPTPKPQHHLEPLGVFKVTGYSDSPRNGTDGRGITKSGERTRWGVVAVDPRVVPLGARLVIEGMEETVFSALDTGGGIVGKWVDVWYSSDSEAIQHGVMQRQLYLVVD